MKATEKARFAKITEGLASRDREVKLSSIAAMGILRIPDHAELLVDLLSSPDEEVVEAALDALGMIGNCRSVKYILEFITGDNAKLADHAVAVLRSFDLKSVLDVVIKTITPDRPPVLRRKLLALVAGIKDPRVLTCMNEVVGQTQDAGLLTEALGYYVRFPSADKRTVLKMLAGSNQWEIAMTANLALSRLQDEPARAQLKRLIKSPAHPIRLALVSGMNRAPMIEDRELYEAFFRDQHPQIRLLAFGGFHLFPATERYDLLKEWLSREKDEAVYLEILHHAAQEKDPRFFPEFEKFLTGASEPLKKLAREATIQMGQAIVPHILKAFPKMSLVLREQMVVILGAIGGSREVVKRLAECLGSSERWLKLNAIDALSQMKITQFADHFAEMTRQETDVWVRATLLSSLSRISGAKHLVVFKENLKHADARVRANAIDGFRACHDKENIRLIEEMLRDPNDRVRVNAAITLSQMGAETVVDELVKMTRDSTKWVKSSAAFALGEIGDAEATPALLELLKSPEDVVYRNALEALGKIGDIRGLIPLLKERDKKRVTEDVFARILNLFAEKHQKS